ncbi:insulinase family protein [bacterium]|nr:insulinase family protein [bacterium]
MDSKDIILKNKARIVYKRIPQYHSVSVGMFIKAGSRFETEENSGVSHLIEHLLFKGTKKRSCNSIKEEIEGVGGTFNGFTSEEITCYWIKILGDYFDLSFDVLSDMIQNPSMKNEDIEKERRVVLEEINMYRDIPARYVFEVFDRQLFDNHPLGQPIAGTPESVKGMSKENILNYMKNCYTSENIVVSITGNVSEQQVVETSEKYLNSLKSKNENMCTEWTKKTSGPSLKNIYKKTEQTHIAMGGIGISRLDEKDYVLKALNVIFGGNMSSRLFNRIREEMSLAYAIRSMTSSYNDTGSYVIYAGVSPENTEKCISAVLDEMKKIKDHGISENELARAKKFLSSQLLMGLEDNLEYMLWIGEQKLMKDSVTTKKKILKQIESVSTKDIKELAETLFKPSNFYVSLIGPQADESEILKVASKL